MTRGKHFDIWEWVDFVRGMTEPATAAAMERHLAIGCKGCERMVRVLRGFADRAPLETRYEPAANVVRRAEAIFPLRQPAPSLLGRLVYDSFREPLPAGLRAEERVSRHALYEAPGFFVDLQLEHEPGSGMVTLVGQISERDQPRADTSMLPVLLMSGRWLVASAICNRLGEFELEYKPARDLRLHVPLRDAGGHLELRLDELVPVAKKTRRVPRRTQQ